MKHVNRTPLRIGMVLIKWLLILVLTVMGVSVLLESCGEYQRYLNVYKRGVTIAGEAYTVEEVYDSENGSDYYVHIRYTYEGKQYTTRYPKDFGSQRKAEELLGQMLEVTVNPDSPGEKISEIKSGVRSFAIISGVMLSIACGCLFIRHRKYSFEVFGWQRESVMKDMKRKWCADWRFSVWFLTAGIWFLMIPVVYDEVFGGFCYIWGALALILGCGQVKKQLRYRAANMRDDYTFSRDKLIKKEIDDDSDSTTYCLHYSDGQNYWNINVSAKKYYAAREGDVAETVRFSWEKKPYLHFNRRIDTQLKNQ